MSLVRLTPLLAAVALAAGLAACENTVRGFGQDMQKTGKAIEKATGAGPAAPASSSTATPQPKQ